MLDQAQSPNDDTSLSSASLCPAPVCRQFWKAGNYDESSTSKPHIQNTKNYLHVHPKFLHSNATSHKWAFGAVAELLDNAIDEIQNGATFVAVDRIFNARDRSPALLIQDDGGGMDPEAIRRCMSFGFSDKKSKSAIGQYGNGFKTSTMRLGADVIVFSRRVDNRTSTSSIGLLSYTYLTRTCMDRIVVPMVDYVNISSDTLEPLHRHGREHFLSNISLLLEWSPYATEADLIKQFDDIGIHGTKVIIYNLWQDEEGVLEFDFETDPADIRLGGSNKSETQTPKVLKNEGHIGNQYRYSLRVYLSILYLRLPQKFRMILRGRIVEHHNIANDLKYVEFILYKPQTGGTVEGQVITTIGFLKEAPHIAIHGFNVYHKNRLILPFWHVVSYSDSRGRGVVGVLEANFVEPTHNKQDFEKTSLFQKLENRLKEMTWEYWDFHCGLVGYQVKKKNPRALMPSQEMLSDVPKRIMHEPVMLNMSPNITDSQNSAKQHVCGMRTQQLASLSEPQRIKRKAGEALDSISPRHNMDIQQVASAGNQLNSREAVALIGKNKKLLEKCFEHEKIEEQLNHKVLQLRRELEEAQQDYARMLAELNSLDGVKVEK